MTIFMSFQWLTGKIKAGSARLASAVSPRTWVVRRSLSNRQMLKGRIAVMRPCQKSCKLRLIVAHSEGEYFQNTRCRMQMFDEEAGGLANPLGKAGVLEPRSYRNSTGALNLGHGGPDNV